MRGVLADTGPLYAAVDPADTYHASARETIAGFDRDGIELLVPYSTLAECCSLILRRFSLPVAHQWLRDVEDGMILVNPVASDFQLALDTVYRYQDQAVTVFDAATLAVSRRLHLPIWTYDHHFDVLRAEIWR